MPEFENLDPFIRKGKNGGKITPVAPYSGSPQNYKPVKRDRQHYAQKPSLLRVPKAENVEMIDLREMEKAYRVADRNNKHKPQPARRNNRSSSPSNPWKRLVQAIKSFFLPKKKPAANIRPQQRQRTQSSTPNSRNADRDNRRPSNNRQGPRQRSDRGDSPQNRSPRPPRKPRADKTQNPDSRNQRPPRSKRIPENRSPQSPPSNKEAAPTPSPIVAKLPSPEPKQNNATPPQDSTGKPRNRRNRRRTNGPSSQTFTPNSNDFNQ